MRFVPSTIALALALSGIAHAADLTEVYRAAKNYDASFAAAQATHRAGQELTKQAQALWQPTVEFDASVGRGRVNPSAGSGVSTSSQSYGFSLSQPLYNSSVSVGKAKLLEGAKLADVQYSAAEQDLIVRVADAYFDVLLAQESVTLVRAQKEAVSQQLAQAKKSFEVGVATITDTHEAQARFDGIVASEIAAENDLAVKQNAFMQLTGVPGEGLAGIGARMTASAPEPNDVNVWVSRAEASSQRIAAQRGQLAMAIAEIDKYRFEKEPTLGLRASWTDGKEKVAGLTKSDGSSSSIGIALNIPLYNGGSTSSKLREAIAKRDAEQQTLEATRREVAQTAKQAFLGVKSGAAQIRALEQALVSNQSSLDSTKLGKEVGVRTTLDLLNAQQQYYSTRKDLAAARYQYLLNRLRLSQAVGELSEKDLEAVNSQLGK